MRGQDRHQETLGALNLSCNPKSERVFRASGVSRSFDPCPHGVVPDSSPLAPVIFLGFLRASLKRGKASVVFPLQQRLELRSPVGTWVQSLLPNPKVPHASGGTGETASP